MRPIALDTNTYVGFKRGGSWVDLPGVCRSACRARVLPDDADVGVGFRVVCLPQGPSLNA